MSGCQEFPGKLQFIDFILGISISLIAHFLRATIFLHTFIIPTGPNMMFNFLLSLHIFTRFSDLQKRSFFLFCLFKKNNFIRWDFAIYLSLALNSRWASCLNLPSCRDCKLKEGCLSVPMVEDTNHWEANESTGSGKQFHGEVCIWRWLVLVCLFHLVILTSQWTASGI